MRSQMCAHWSAKESLGRLVDGFARELDRYKGR